MLRTLIVVHRKWIRCPAGSPQCPGYGARFPPTERLLREHEAMLEEIDKLVTMARVAFATADDTSDLAKRFSRFHTQLIHHEQEENKLIQDVYNVDIGTKD